eukprot:7078224-Alexandrium_andersonii.AAC.1
MEKVAEQLDEEDTGGAGVFRPVRYLKEADRFVEGTAARKATAESYVAELEEQLAQAKCEALARAKEAEHAVAIRDYVRDAIPRSAAVDAGAAAMETDEAAIGQARQAANDLKTLLTPEAVGVNAGQVQAALGVLLGALGVDLTSLAGHDKKAASTRSRTRSRRRS